MKIIPKKIALFCIIGLSSLMRASSCDDTSPDATSPYFSIRSQGRDKVIQMVGMVGHTHLCGSDAFDGTIAITPEYTKSFRSAKIVHCLFGPDVIDSPNCDDDPRCIRIQGSRVQNREERAWLADNFYLPTDFDSTICFEPRIRNFLLNLDWYHNLDMCMPGLYFRLYGPVVWSKWDLNFCETVSEQGTNSYEPGYFAPVGIKRSELLKDFSSYACGCAPEPVGDVLFNGLQYARIPLDAHSRAGFAELRAEFGWDFWCDDCNHLGVNIQAAAPTGTRPKGCIVFEPIIGNGHHWELGAGFTGHHLFYLCNENDRCFGFYYDVSLTHLFGTKQRRTFDLLTPNSRYQLAERLGKPVQNQLAGKSAAEIGSPFNLADFQFQNEYTPVANLTTCDVHVSSAVQADIVAMLNFCVCNWTMDLGYNFWMRSCEKIHRPDPRNQIKCEAPNICDSRSYKTWALKGDSRVFGFAGAQAGGLEADQPVALSATQKNSTIHAGTNATAGLSTDVVDPVRQNAGVDNALFAVAGTNGAARLIHTPLADGGFNIATDQIKTSIQPMFIKCKDVNLLGTRGLSHKIFAHLSYTWWDHDCWTPFFGFGGFGEFGKNEKNCPPRPNAIKDKCPGCADCFSCLTCSLSQWGIWVKGGISF